MREIIPGIRSFSFQFHVFIFMCLDWSIITNGASYSSYFIFKEWFTFIRSKH